MAVFSLAAYRKGFFYYFVLVFLKLYYIWEYHHPWTSCSNIWYHVADGAVTPENGSECIFVCILVQFCAPRK